MIVMILKGLKIIYNLFMYIFWFCVFIIERVYSLVGDYVNIEKFVENSEYRWVFLFWNILYVWIKWLVDLNIIVFCLFFKNK